MSRPRRVVPGTTYLITRRCAGRRFLLRPDPDVARAFLYCVAVAAERTGVLVHNVGALSNHYHVLGTDPEGRLPEFLHWLDRHLAMFIKVLRDEPENVWSTDKASAVALLTPERVLEKMVYVSTQAVEAGLVRHVHEWPGAHVGAADFGAPRTFVRPTRYFRENGAAPETATLRVTMPPMLAHLGFEPETFGGRFMKVVETKAKELVHAALAAGRRFLGADAVLTMSPYDSPDTREPTRALNPEVAASGEHARAAKLDLRAWRARYRASLLRWCAGERDVEFPCGTYWMRKFARVNVTGPP